MSKSEYKHRKYHVEEYNPLWKDRFGADEKILRGIWKSDAAAIEHIGSTSVPGMAGKPTIDILILVNDLATVKMHSTRMVGEGYEFLPSYVMPDSYLFRRVEDNTLLTNVHIFQKDHPHVREMIALRNYLRDHPETVKEYTAVKWALAEKYPDNYAQYRKEKDAYMDELKRKTGISH